MKLIALKKIARGTPPGHVFEIRDKEARALIALKLAKPFEVVDAASLDLTSIASGEADTSRPRRRYQRRDLTVTD